MEATSDSQEHRVSIRIKFEDALPVNSLRIDIGEDIVISYDTPESTPSPEAEDDAAPPGFTPKCWTCSRPGHFARQCLSDHAPIHGACFECGSAGHHARACPIPSMSPSLQTWDMYVCKVHNMARGSLSIYKDESGGWQCKPDALCSDLA